MKKCAVIGATGYVGAELVKLIYSHPQLELAAVVASSQNQHISCPYSMVVPQLKGVVDLSILSIGLFLLQLESSSIDAVFLATPPEISMDIVPQLIAAKVDVFDLGGAFRLKNMQEQVEHYGNTALDNSLHQNSYYCLPEHADKNIVKDADLIALPGCYPTASILGLKPLVDKQLVASTPVIHAVSGATGAGKSIKQELIFSELSYKPYGVVKHRHQPEIEQELGCDVAFTPHVAPFSRGLTASITVKLSQQVTHLELLNIYQQAYISHPLIRLVAEPPAVAQVVNSSFCDIHFHLCKKTGFAKVFVAIDNLLKGASSQAIQAVNLKYDFDETLGLLPTSGYHKPANTHQELVSI